MVSVTPERLCVLICFIISEHRVVCDIGCRYEMCFSNTYRTQTFFGCVVQCYHGTERLLLADCEDAYSLLSANATERFDELAFGVGLRYYIGGYVSRGLAAKIKSLSMRWNFWTYGGLNCSTDSAGSPIGLLEIKINNMAFMYANNDGNPARSWVLDDSTKDGADILSILNTGINYDETFLRTACRRVLHRAGLSAAAARLRQLGMKEPKPRCIVSRMLVSEWRDLWMSWSKYGELRRASFVRDFVERTPKKKKKNHKMLGIVALVGGAFMLLLMFFVMAVKRKSDIMKDFNRRRVSLRNSIA